MQALVIYLRNTLDDKRLIKALRRKAVRSDTSVSALCRTLLKKNQKAGDLL